jgi:hypothetical protein
MSRVALLLAILISSGAGEQTPQTRRQAPAQLSGTARIRGSVVDAASGTPVRRAAVRLMMTPAGGNWTALTDGSGAFEFPGLPAGRFTLSVTKAAFMTVSAGQRSTTDPPQPIELADAQTHDLTPIRLPRGGVITGRISDEYGEPVPEVIVQAFRAQYMQGMRRLIDVRSAQTNDIGQYRIYGLQPGTYYVAASIRGATGSPIQMREPATEAVRGAAGLASSFFPGTVTAAEAQRIEVVAGGEASAIDFPLLPVRLARISGAIVDSRGRPAGRQVVFMNVARPDRALLGGTIMAEADSAGRFTLANVPPGDYRLDVRSVRDIESMAQTGTTG